MPEKALLLSQLTLKEPDFTSVKSAQVASSNEPGSIQTKSAHEVLPGSWVDPANGQIIEGFYKPVTTPDDNENNYPILLAKYDVAISVFTRSFLGEIAAEDRLVFDDEGHIVGTFSRKLPHYKPMASRERPLAADEKDPELVCPTEIKTLIEHNVARILTGEWYINNVDLHPYNMSIEGDGGVLDYDESFARHTLIIKGGEGFVKWWETKLVNPPQELVGEDLNLFPILSEGNKRKHWPTNFLPGNWNWSKQFQSYLTFESVAFASNKHVKLASEKKISFQEQMFESLVTMLVTYDQDMLRARLYEYLGDMPLDFMTLPESRKEALHASDGQSFNAKTDKGLFVDHMMKVFQQQYDELYRAVVFYKGFKPEVDSLACPVVSFLDFLRNRPSARKKTIEWAKEQNKQFNFSNEAAFNEKKMDARYAQIWRDAHLIPFCVIWRQCIELVLDIANALSIEPIPNLNDFLFKMDEKTTATGQVINSLMDLLTKLTDSVKVDSDPESKLTQGLKSLIDFLANLTRASQVYFNGETKSFKLESANRDFCLELLKLPQLYQDNIYADFSSTGWDVRFGKEADAILSLYVSLSLLKHKSADDDELTSPIEVDSNALLDRPHTNPEVVNTFIKVLIDWANNIDRDVLISLISMAKDEYEAPLIVVPSIFGATSEIKIQNPLANRRRGSDIAPFLKEVQKNTDVKGADIIARVLSTGGCATTSLNYKLIAKILPLVLMWVRETGGYGIDNAPLMILEKASIVNKVANDKYTEWVAGYIRSAKEFTHIYTQQSQLEFNRAMYRWANRISPERFVALVNKALNDYEPENKSDASLATWTWGFFRSAAHTVIRTVSRLPEVRGYLHDKTLSNAGILGSIFKGGGVGEAGYVASRSLNVWLFDIIFDEMKKDISIDPDGMAKDEDFEIISKIDKVTAQSYLQFPSFRDLAEEYSSQRGVQAGRPQEATEEQSQAAESLPMAASM